MTCVTAIKSGNTIFVGSDCGFQSGNTIDVAKEGTQKIWRTSDSGVVFGHSGNIIDRNILSISDDLIDDAFMERTIQYKDVVSIIVPKMMTLLENRGRISNESGKKSMDSSFILAHRDQFFEISSDGCVTVSNDDYVSIGSGYELADGAFQIIKDDDRFTAEQKIARILIAVCAKHAYVNYPIQIINTGNTNVTIIQDEREGLLFTQYKKRKGKQGGSRK